MMKYTSTAMAIAALLLASCSTMDLARSLNGIGLPTETEAMETATEPSIGFSDTSMPDGFSGWTVEEKLSWLDYLDSQGALTEDLKTEYLDHWFPEETVEILPGDMDAPPDMPAEALEMTAEEEAIDPVEDMRTEPLAEVAVETETPPGGSRKLPEGSTTVSIGSNVIPAWFVYISSILILACLLTICYISKQRKETYWRRGRD